MMIILNSWAGNQAHCLYTDLYGIVFLLLRQTLQCKEATPPLQNKKFTRPPSCARRHLVFDSDTQFNSIDSGFVDEYILQPPSSEEQVCMFTNMKLAKIDWLFFRLILYTQLVKS